MKKWLLWWHADKIGQFFVGWTLINVVILTFVWMLFRAFTR